MAPTFEQAYPILYKGWDRIAALADYNAGGWRNKAGVEQFLGGTPEQKADNVVQSSVDAWTKLVQETSKRFKDYNAQNPFIVDDVLKQKQLESKEQLDPYYNEQLANYLLGTQRKLERGAQDTHDLLNELSAQTAQYSQDAQFKLSTALEKAAQGYADVGLYDSGARYRTQGLLETDAANQSQDFLRRQVYKENLTNLGQQRTQEDIGLGSLTGQNLSNVKNLNLANATGLGLEPQQEIRNVERQRFTETEARANELTREAGQKYVAGFQASLPPQTQQNTSYDLLKQIGIYT